MDSSLLNAVHDDPFDGDYVKYDTETQFWSTESDKIGLQLTETLHGILPIAPTEVEPSILKNIVPDDYKKQSFGTAVRKQLSSIGTFDANVEYSSESTNLSCGDEEIKECEGKLGVVQSEGFRSLSSSTFRSRTESSSIGDYESHSSDYDFSSDETDLNYVQRETSFDLTTELRNGDLYHPPTNEFIKSEENTDPFAMHLDVNTFDLAAFITQDDQVFETHSPLVGKFPSRLAECNELGAQWIDESDSDVIVDVETVENENASFMDQGKENECVKQDSLRTLTTQQNVKNEIKTTEPNFTRNFTVIPNKRQNDFLKGKFGLGRGKNLNMHRNTIKTSPKPVSKIKLQQNKNNSVKKNLKPKNQDSEVNLKHFLQKQQMSVQNSTLDQKQAISDFNLPKTKPKDYSYKEPKEVVVCSQEMALPTKRRLNIEEYKKRREHSLFQKLVNKTFLTTKHLKEDALQQTPTQTIVKPSFKTQISKPLQTPAVTLIVKGLKDDKDVKCFVDPITEAKNKVLRIQELKKAKQIRIIDSTVSSKVGRVTKLLPLKDIVKNSYKKDILVNELKTSEYEEVTCVSIGCNTDIIIPSHGFCNITRKDGIYKSRSLLKSNNVPANIKNSIEICNDSFIVRIQDVVSKKNATKAPQTSITTFEHGEDKVIMHLRKDRIRARKLTQFTQTDMLPEFFTLPFPNVQFIGKRCDSFPNRKRLLRRKKYNVRQSSLSSDDEDQNYANQRRSNNIIRKSAISSSLTESDDEDLKSSSSSDHRSRSKSIGYVNNSCPKTSSQSKSRRGREYTRHDDTMISAAAFEERRIVYVGRVEQDTTREMLRKKFITYGPIRQVTIHYKDTGMKYGFVTYEQSEDAFRVIDGGQNDATINMYDISFGGRRAFCRASYADLDNAGINQSYQPYILPRQVVPIKEDSFEALLIKVKARLNATNSLNSSNL